MECSMIPSCSPKKALLAVAVSFALSPFAANAACWGPVTSSLSCSDSSQISTLSAANGMSVFDFVHIEIDPSLDPTDPDAGKFGIRFNGITIGNNGIANAVELTNRSTTEILTQTIRDTAVIANAIGVNIDSGRNTTVNMQGSSSITVANGTGIKASAAGGGQNKISLESSTSIKSGTGIDFASTAPASHLEIINDGIIDATGTGILANVNGDVKISNSNIINGAVNLTTTSTVDVTNTGAMSSNVVVNNAGTNSIITNSGSMVGNLNITSTGDSIVRNNGNYTGQITLAGATTRLDNIGTWALAGTGGATLVTGTVNNNGSIVWANPTSGAANNITITGSTNFNHNGIIDLTNLVAGDIFKVDSGTFAGGVGSSVILEAVLGDDGAGNIDIADKLDLTGATITGITEVQVVNLGGHGNDTGKVLLVEGATPAGDGSEFTLQGGYATGGIYIYDQFKHENVGGVDGWYLYTTRGTGPGPAITPIVPSYLANQNAAINMFSLAMHDRIGEPRYTEAYRPNTYNRKRAQSLWLRTSGSRSTSDMLNDSSHVRNYLGVAQIGGDAASWEIGDNRYHLGFMAGFGENHAKVKSNVISVAEAKGKVKGYSMGLYGTWYKNNKQNTGFYGDTWTQLSSFRNEVTASGVEKDDYRSYQWASSIELGYGFLAYNGRKTQWLMEPQGQIIYQMYSSKDHSNSSGLTISGGRLDSYETRLGLRTYLSNKQKKNAIQPFVTANWYNNQKIRGLKFNGQQMTGGMPENRFEVKLGAEGEVRKRVQLYGHVSQIWGSEETYRNTQAMIGAKVMF